MIKLNLLPLKEKQEAKLDSFIRWLAFLVVPVSVFLLIFILFLVSAFFSLLIMLKAQEKAIKIQEDNFKTQKLLEIEEKIAGINQIITQVHSKQNETISWTLILEEISEITLRDVYLVNLSYDKSKNIIRLNGWAEKRQHVLFMEKLLEKSPLFEHIDSPLSNLIKQDNVDFNFSFRPVLRSVSQ
ncbi:MAG: hypothetical protein U9P63_00525 [Patescibacteria group bacterium]|nr:hypothetical protein [Patescibacteria group bacterium]